MKRVQKNVEERSHEKKCPGTCVDAKYITSILLFLFTRMWVQKVARLGKHLQHINDASLHLLDSIMRSPQSILVFVLTKSDYRYRSRGATDYWNIQLVLYSHV